MSIPVFKPLLTSDEKQAAVEALDNGWLGMGSYVGEFENAVAKTIGCNETHSTIAVSTGHAALHLILMQLGVGSGDEVITPSFNNVADFQAILAVGAQPVFCDVLLDTLCADPKSVERVIGPNTKAIIFTDYACHLSDYCELKKISQKYGIPVIHDAAHVFGSKVDGKPVGTQFEYTMFSFDPVKTVTAIDAGVIISKNKSEKIDFCEKRLIGMGQSSQVMYKNQRAWNYDVTQIGFRYHLANIHAAIGLQQIAKLDGIKASRISTCKRYQRAFENIDGLGFPIIDNEDIIPFIFYVKVLKNKRNTFMKHLKDEGVDCGIHWQAGHQFSLFKNCRKDKLTSTNEITKQIVTLPLHSFMEKGSEDKVIETVCSFF